MRTLFPVNLLLVRGRFEFSVGKPDSTTFSENYNRNVIAECK